jgi:hypothetical protein
MTTKHCPQCDHDKPLDDFPNNATRADGKGGWCKECMREYTKAWKVKNPEINRLHAKLYYHNKKLRTA